MLSGVPTEFGTSLAQGVLQAQAPLIAEHLMDWTDECK